MPLPAMSGAEPCTPRRSLYPRRYSRLAPGQAAHKSRHFVGQDVAEQIRRDNNIKLPRIEHELHRAGIYDAVVHRDVAFVPLGNLSANANLEDRGFSALALWTTITFLRPLRNALSNANLIMR